MNFLEAMDKFVTEEKAKLAGGLYNLNPLEAAGKKKRAKKAVAAVPVPVPVAVPADVLIAGKKKRVAKKAVVAEVPVVAVQAVVPVVEAGKIKKKRAPLSDATKAKLAGSSWRKECDALRAQGVPANQVFAMASKARKEKK